MNNLEYKKMVTSISQSLFDEKHPTVDEWEREAVHTAIWYLYNTRYGKDKLLRKSSKPCGVSIKSVDSYIRGTLGNDVYKKRSWGIDKSFVRQVNNKL